MAKRKEGKLIEVGIARGVKKKTTQRSLRCDLKQAEQLTKGIELAQVLGQVQEVEAKKAAAVAEFKKSIESLEGHAETLAVAMNQGWEFRMVECHVVCDYQKGTVCVIRRDTQETIEERAMTEEERQVSFFEEDDEADENTKNDQGASTSDDGSSEIR